MKSTSAFSASLFSGPAGLGAVTFAAVVALAGCSTVKDLSPFASNVPYAQDIQPTIARPAVSEIPAFKPSPPSSKPVPRPPAASPRVAPTPDAASPPADTPPAGVQPPAAPQAAAPPPAAPPSAAPPAQSALSVPAAVKSASAAAPPTAASDTAPTPPVAADGSVTPGRHLSRAANTPPSIADEDRNFKDDGTYPNLAQVPARPVNMPTFQDTAAIEKTLIADRDSAKDKRPDSPGNPAPDTLPDPVSPRQVAIAPPAAPAIVIARTEDRSPCLSSQPVKGAPAATLRFQPGSAALSADDLIILADAIPAVRAGTGAIRIFGHGDADPAASQAARFDLAAARAAAVAQALAGYGVPVPRIAVDVACADASMAAASVQLYAES